MDNWLDTKELPIHFVAACGLVYKGERVLLIHTARRGWDMPGGVIEPGEPILEGLQREILEETGIESIPVSFVGIYQNLSWKKGYGPLEGMKLPPVVNLTFCCQYIGGTEHITEECDDVGWFTAEEAKERVGDRFPTIQRKLDDLLAFDGTLNFVTFKKEDLDEKILDEEKLN